MKGSGSELGGVCLLPSYAKRDVRPLSFGVHEIEKMNCSKNFGAIKFNATWTLKLALAGREM